MSRYGRNQKRRHREETKRLEREVRNLNFEKLNLQHHCGDQSLTIQKLEDHIERWNIEIIERLGDMSAFLSEPARMDVEEFIRQVPVYKRMEPPCVMSPTDCDIWKDEVFKVAFLDTFKTFTADDDMKASSHIRLVQHKSNGSKGYSVACDLSDDTVLSSRDINTLMAMVLKDMARMLEKKFGTKILKA